MDYKYLIVIFKNKERYKILKKYKTYKNAYQFFNEKLKESDEVIYDIKFENGKFVDYEIGLIEKNDQTKPQLFRVDEFGRNVKISTDDSNMNVLKMEKYNYQESIYHIDFRKRILADDLVKTELKEKTLKLFSKLNNKVIVQNDEKITLYSLKSDLDADRFLDEVQKYSIKEKKDNCLIVKDTSREQRKYLYGLLVNKGYSKKMLYRKSTTHPKDI
jgi:hypothetical protein